MLTPEQAMAVEASFNRADYSLSDALERARQRGIITDSEERAVMDWANQHYGNTDRPEDAKDALSKYQEQAQARANQSRAQQSMSFDAPEEPQREEQAEEIDDTPPTLEQEIEETGVPSIDTSNIGWEKELDNDTLNEIIQDFWKSEDSRIHNLSTFNQGLVSMELDRRRKAGLISDDPEPSRESTDEPPETFEEVIQQEQRGTPASGIQMVDIGDIDVRPEWFQFRGVEGQREVNPENVRNIADDWDVSRLDPIDAAFDPRTGRYVVLGGHHRFEAAELVKERGGDINPGSESDELPIRLHPGDPNDPEERRRLRETAITSNFGRRSMRLSEVLNNIRQLREDGNSNDEIAGKMNLRMGEFDRYDALSYLPRDVLQDIELDEDLQQYGIRAGRMVRDSGLDEGLVQAAWNRYLRDESGQTGKRINQTTWQNFLSGVLRESSSDQVQAQELFNFDDEGQAQFVDDNPQISALNIITENLASADTELRRFRAMSRQADETFGEEGQEYKASIDRHIGDLEVYRAALEQGENPPMPSAPSFSAPTPQSDIPVLEPRPPHQVEIIEEGARDTSQLGDFRQRLEQMPATSERDVQPMVTAMVDDLGYSEAKGFETWIDAQNVPEERIERDPSAMRFYMRRYLDAREAGEVTPVSVSPRYADREQAQSKSRELELEIDELGRYLQTATQVTDTLTKQKEQLQLEWEAASAGGDMRQKERIEREMHETSRKLSDAEAAQNRLEAQRDRRQTARARISRDMGGVIATIPKDEENMADERDRTREDEEQPEPGQQSDPEQQPAAESPTGPTEADRPFNPPRIAHPKSKSRKGAEEMPEDPELARIRARAEATQAQQDAADQRAFRREERRADLREQARERREERERERAERQAERRAHGAATTAWGGQPPFGDGIGGGDNLSALTADSAFGPEAGAPSGDGGQAGEWYRRRDRFGRFSPGGTSPAPRRKQPTTTSADPIETMDDMSEPTIAPEHADAPAQQQRQRAAAPSQKMPDIDLEVNVSTDGSVIDNVSENDGNIVRKDYDDKKRRKSDVDSDVAVLSANRGRHTVSSETKGGKTTTRTRQFKPSKPTRRRTARGRKRQGKMFSAMTR